MAKKKPKRLSPRKCVAAVRAIHDILYLDSSNNAYHNTEKEWNADTLQMIAEVLQTAIPTPPMPSISCALCRAKKYPHQVHLDREGEPICDSCWDPRMR